MEENSINYRDGIQDTHKILQDVTRYSCDRRRGIFARKASRSSSCADGGGNDIHYRPHLFDLGNSKQIPIVDGGIPFLTCSFLVLSSIISIQFRLASTELLFDIFFE